MRNLIVCLALALSQLGLGQTVDLVSDCSSIRLKSDSRFDGIVSSLVFTVSWPEKDRLVWEPTRGAVIVSPSGGEMVDRGRRYRTFTAVGFSHLKEFGEAIGPDREAVVLKYSGTVLRLEGAGKAVNTEYYVSLNGKNSTGWVESAECEDRVEVIVFPNPTQTEINVSIVRGSFSEVALISPSGKTVYLSSINSDRFTIPARGFSPGQYTIRLIGDDTHSAKIIIKR